jgi:hypothetical protein
MAQVSENKLTPAALHDAVEKATTTDQLAEIERQAREVGYSPDGILLTKLTEKRNTMRGGNQK